jgi:hypothetical protein
LVKKDALLRRANIKRKEKKISNVVLFVASIESLNTLITTKVPR